MTRPLRIGLLGCGEVTQIIHIPALRQLGELFSLVALHDASPKVAAALVATLPDARACDSVASLLALPDLDAVLVATPDALHAEHAIAAMRSGRHVLVEKPMCMNLDEADALAAAEAETGRVVQVGYMRRYAPAFVEAVGLLDEDRSGINFARVRNFVGRSRAFMDSIAQVVRADDLPAHVKAEAAEKGAAALRRAIGTDAGVRAAAYFRLLGLSSHDVSAMRELLGPPLGVLSATARREGRFLLATFDYGDYVCSFETGADGVPRFDTGIEVLTQRRLIRVDYDTPYIRHQPARLTVSEPCSETGVSVRQSYPSRQDAFVPEWRHFHDSVRRGTRPKTSVADAREDLELFRQMMAVMQP